MFSALTPLKKIFFVDQSHLLKRNYCMSKIEFYCKVTDHFVHKPRIQLNSLKLQVNIIAYATIPILYVKWMNKKSIFILAFFSHHTTCLQGIEI